MGSRILAAAASALLLASCILVVSPETYGTRCRFAGETSQCGSCVAFECRRQLEDCCEDGSCNGALAAVERCAQGGACAFEGTSSLAQCARDKCSNVCRSAQGTSRTRCTEPPLGVGTACSCTVTDAPNDAFCDPIAYRQTICCAPKGWPGPGLECSCQPVSCSSTSDGCFCSRVTSTPTQRTCAGLKCCVSEDSCVCRSKDCFDFETPTESCGVEAVGCKEGQIRVDSCAVRQ